MNRALVGAAVLALAVAFAQANTSYNSYGPNSLDTYGSTSDKYGSAYYYAKEETNPLKAIAKAIQEKFMKAQAEKDLKKAEEEMKKAAEKYAVNYDKKAKEVKTKEYVPNDVYYVETAPAFSAASMSGSIYCFKSYLQPQYVAPTFTCPPGYKSSTDDYGNTACIKVSTKCLPGKVLLKNGECCTKCPEGYTQKGDQCCGTPKTKCWTSTKPCTADCQQKMMCEKPDDYSKGKCKYQCCKTTQDTFPIMCTNAQTYTDTCAADISCSRGTYDVKAGKCLVATGGWSVCPPKYVTCLCKKNEESFCVVPELYGMFDTCELICQRKPNLARVKCPAVRSNGNTYKP